MSHSTFLTTNDVSSTNYHHGLVSTNISINRKNPKIKKNLKDKRRATGIRPNDVSLASTPTEDLANDDDAEEEPADLSRTLTSSKPAFTLIPPSFENLSIARTEPPVRTSPSSRIFLPEEFRLHCIDKQTSNDDSPVYKTQQLEERILALESILYEKDNIIHDLQHKLDIVKQDFNDAEQQIYRLQQDKLTLIKALTSIQENKPSIVDHPRRYSRN